ncbi:hypothetical protein C8R43DRAFT_948544 [Mycena crocata]|nr:hypothetical protein C8R43DRAFT_948544 [Mycena crocata]
MIPYAVGARHRSAYSSVRQMAAQFADNRMNDGKNAFSMRHIGVADSFPGITVDSSLGWFRSTYLFLSRVFQAQSIKSTAWVAPMRQEFLQQYIELNQAMTRTPGDIQHLTMGPFQDETTAVMRKRPSGYKYRWTFHREVTPTRILSIRSADGNFDKEMPATGSRLAVQALVRFDTEQGVEIYDNDGKALHTPALAATPQPTRLGKALHTVPAKPQRVTEYLVLDKALYVPGAEWRFRARFTPIPGRTVAV